MTLRRYARSADHSRRSHALPTRPSEYTGTCQICSKTFAARVNRPMKYCSRECSRVGHYKPRQFCERCGKQRADRKHTSRRFCSRACSDAAAVKRRPICPICQKEPIRLGHKTCSTACGYEHRKQAVKPRACPHCGEMFRPHPSALLRQSGKFCSLACYRAVQAQRPAMIDVPCDQCGTRFRRTQGAIKRNQHSFCSRKCSSAYNSGETSSNWRGGLRRGYRGPGWRKIAAEVRERDGHRCRRCGKPESQEGRLLSVDHIIPYRTFDTPAEANVLSNLVALCGSCHGKKARAERLWLKGDVLDMWSYQIAVAEPWKATG